MPRKKEKLPADYACLQSLKAALWKKIEAEWADKWKPAFGVDYAHKNDISQNKFVKAVHGDIAAVLQGKSQEGDAPKRMFSEKTLKRILNPDNNSGLQVYTKDCLAIYLGYKDYAHFCKACQEHAACGKRTRKHKNLLLWALPVLVFATGILSWLLLGTRTNPQNSFSVTTIADSSGLPVTLQVAYKVNAKNSFKFLTSQGHYLTDTLGIEKRSGIIPLVQWRPAVLNLQLVGNQQVHQDTFVSIESDGWRSWYTSRGERQEIAPKEVYRQHDALWYPPGSIAQKHRKDYWTKFIYIRPFAQSADSLTATFRVKNSEATGGLFCFDTGFALYGSKGRFWTAFQKDGCNYYSRFEAPDTVVSRENSLAIQKMAADFSAYTKLTLKACYPDVTLKKGNDTVFTLPYSQKAGKLQGFDVFFRGSGMLDEVVILSANKDTVYREGF